MCASAKTRKGGSAVVKVKNLCLGRIRLRRDSRRVCGRNANGVSSAPYQFYRDRRRELRPLRRRPGSTIENDPKNRREGERMSTVNFVIKKSESRGGGDLLSVKALSLSL